MRVSAIGKERRDRKEGKKKSTVARIANLIAFLSKRFQHQPTFRAPKLICIRTHRSDRRSSPARRTFFPFLTLHSRQGLPYS